MHENLKYVIVDDMFPVLFQKGIKHDEILRDNSKITGAGFYKALKFPEEIRVYSYGASESLGIESKDKDGVLIEKFLNRTS